MIATRTVSLVLLAMLVALGGCRKSQSPRTVTIEGREWQVELATTIEQREAGLAGRSDLPDRTGMLFVYPQAQPLAFCMRGCLIDLDIAFIDSSMRVVAVHTMTVEPDLVGREVYLSGVAAQFALEVPAGSLARAGVKVGSAVEFGRGMPDPAKAAPHP